MSDNRGLLEGKVLDYGCGDKPYESIIDCDEYIGVDVKVSGHGMVPKADYFFESGRLPFDDMTFDNVISTEVFEHVYEIDDVLNEINHVMRVNDHIVITVPFCNPEHEIPYDFFRYTTYGMTKKLEDHGFTVLKCKMLNTQINAVRQMKVSITIGNYFRKGGVLRAFYSFAVLLINNIAFVLSNKNAENSDFGCGLGVVAIKK